MHDRFDAAIVPYSTFQLLLTAQDRQQAFDEAARVLVPGAYVHIDVSGNFDTRPAADWHITLSAPCAAVDAKVEEWERSHLMPDHVLIEKSFRSGGRTIIEVQERWVYLDALDIKGALDSAGFDLTRVDRGYGGDASPHRLVYHGRRRG